MLFTEQFEVPRDPAATQFNNGDDAAPLRPVGQP